MTDVILARLSEKYTVNENGCWIWHGAKSGSGRKWIYGLLQFKGKLTPAHRVAYELLRGKIPDDCDLDHLCRNTLCVNPWHCEPVTHQENIRRGYDLKPHKTHCVNGHELTADNIYVKTRNGRDSWECKICRKGQWEKFDAKGTRKVAENSRHVFLEYKGERIAQHELAKRHGIKRRVLAWRLKHGRPLKKALKP